MPINGHRAKGIYLAVVIRLVVDVVDGMDKCPVVYLALFCGCEGPCLWFGGWWCWCVVVCVWCLLVYGVCCRLILLHKLEYWFTLALQTL